jgi:hypothetical protein
MHAGFLLIFGPEEGGDTLIRKVASYSDYTALYQKIATFICVWRKTFARVRHLNSTVGYYVISRKLLDGIFKTMVAKIVA